jgi:PAT family beta-lactamase induction signal transducer AmpG
MSGPSGPEPEPEPNDGRRRIPPATLALAVSLYALQGVVIAYFINFNKLYMESRGVAGPLIGRVQSAALAVLVLKFLAGPISDRFNLLGLGHRRPYIVLGLLAQSVGLLGLAFIDPSARLGAFAAMAVLAVAGLGLYDTTCDGLVIDATPSEQDRPRVQGLLWGGRALAAMVFSLAFGWLLTRWGGPHTSDRLLLACAAMGLVPLALALAIREPRRASSGDRFEWSALRVMVRPRALVLLAFGAGYGLIGYGVENNLGLFYKNACGFDPGGDVGWLASLRYLGRALGALALPLAAIRWGRARVLSVGVIVLALSIAGQATVTERASAAGWGFAFGAANGWCDAVFALLAMEASDPRLAASTFALFMAITNLSSVGDALFAELVAASGGDRAGYLRTFLVFALAAAAVLGLVPSLARRPTPSLPLSAEPEPAPDVDPV